MNKWVHKWIKIYLKCYINLILYYRNVYPKESFNVTTYQGFNLPQFMPITRHPDLQDYIEELINDLISKLSHVYKLSIVVLDQTYDICLEKFVLDFSEFKHITHGEKDEGVNGNDEKQQNDDRDHKDNLDEYGDEDINLNIEESEVFDEFRSSLNSLINKLESLPQIKDDTVTFNIMISVVNMELGHAKDVGWNIDSNEKLRAFERDINWAKCRDEDDDNFVNIKNQLPQIKMISLIGCDIGPLIIHNYMELLQLNKMEKIPLKISDIYNVSDSDMSILSPF